MPFLPAQQKPHFCISPILVLSLSAGTGAPAPAARRPKRRLTTEQPQPIPSPAGPSVRPDCLTLRLPVPLPWDRRQISQFAQNPRNPPLANHFPHPHRRNPTMQIARIVQNAPSPARLLTRSLSLLSPRRSASHRQISQSVQNPRNPPRHVTLQHPLQKTAPVQMAHSVQNVQAPEPLANPPLFVRQIPNPKSEIINPKPTLPATDPVQSRIKCSICL